MSMLLSSFASLLASASLNGEDYALSAEQTAKLSYFLSPSMSTSQELPGHSSRTVEDNSSRKHKCSFPSLQLKGSFEGKSNENVSLIEVAAVNMASQMEVDRSSIDQVPRQLLLNVSKSFQQLLVSRIRCSMLALIDKMSEIGNSRNVGVLKRLLASKNLLQITTVVTSFTVIGEEKNTDGQMTAPILFETIVDCSMLGKIHTVTLQAPGTISVIVNKTDHLLDSIEVAFDTIAFLKAMMYQARVLVKKTIRRAAKITAAYNQMKDRQGDKKSTGLSGSARNSSSLSSTPSAYSDINLPPIADSHETQEALHQHQYSPEPADIGESKDHELICSYPAHLRETVKQFLPTESSIADASIEGFPPQLAKTLKLLSSGRYHGDSDSDGSPPPSEADIERLWDGSSNRLFSSSVDASPSQHEQPYDEPNEIMGDDNPRPLKKRRAKVSFLLPENSDQTTPTMERWI